MQEIVLHLHETQQVSNPFQYAGGYFESSTGLVKFGTRYYNPALGRWTQQDPAASSLGNPDSLNRYVYVGDDPVNQVDPSGTFSLPCWLSVPINVFEVVTAAALIYSATLFGLPAAVVAFLSGPITAGTGIAIGLAISFLYAFVVIAGVTTIIQGLEAIRACL